MRSSGTVSITEGFKYAGCYYGPPDGFSTEFTNGPIKNATVYETNNPAVIWPSAAMELAVEGVLQKNRGQK
jgi:hypothetical protein